MKTLNLLILLIALCISSVAQINIGDKIKRKVEQRVERKTDEAIDKGLDEAEGKGEKKESGKKTSEKNDDSETATDKDAEKASESSTSSASASGIKSYSKFDFIRGEKLIYYEDFGPDAIGDFPARWNTNGTGEVVTLDKIPGKWLKMTGSAVFYPEFNTVFPDNFTIEFDIVTNIPSSFGRTSFIISEDETKELGGSYDGMGGVMLETFGQDWSIEGWHSQRSDRIHGKSSFKQLYDLKDKVVHVAFWVQKQRVRIYIDEVKAFDLPRVMPQGLKPNHFKIYNQLYADPPAELFISNVRIAEGAPDMRNKLLTEGRFVTHGITFDVNSDRIKPESYGVIREIGLLMKENPDVKVRIIGHTDSDGTEASNLELSRKRSLAVKKVLESEYDISDSRVETDGKGAKEPAAPNTTAEGKASNRRVEFVKI